MRHHLAKLTPVVLGGCSLLYNPNNIKPAPADASDAQMVDAEMMADAEIDAPPIIDVDPTMLAVMDAWPPVIYEGQGVDNSGKAMLIIKGAHFAADATVSVSPMTDLTLDTPVVSAHHDYIAVPITFAISATDTGLVPLTITVNETGATAQSLPNKVSVQYLKKLTNPALTLPLEARYSQVALTGTPTFAGDLTQPVIIRSVSSITCATNGTASFNAKGANGTNTNKGAGGPGGCPGGDEGSPGGCAAPLVGGGGSSSGANGGGGGGFGTMGANGGSPGGAGHGTVAILSYTGSDPMGADRNQASGGGGGTADGLILVTGGGGGGGGGGSVEMTAGGDIKCGGIDVSGGNGANGAGTLTGGTGGGGGGAGGLVLLRTDRGSITGAAMTANGGGGGNHANGGGGSNGGAGGSGRMRVDTAGTTVPTATPSLLLHRGLSFASSTMPIYTTASPMVTLVGTPGDVFDMYVIDGAGAVREGEPKNQTMDGSGSMSLQVTLIAGYNRLCATIRPGVRNTTDRFSLADTCIELTYLP
jgi:hypothetical protein